MTGTCGILSRISVSGVRDARAGACVKHTADLEVVIDSSLDLAKQSRESIWFRRDLYVVRLKVEKSEKHTANSLAAQRAPQQIPIQFRCE